MLRSLGVRNYRLFLTGQISKLLGLWMQFTAQDWLVLELSHDSAQALGVVTALQFTPLLLFTLYGGKLADRYDKRRLLVGAHIAFLILAVVLGALATTGAITLGGVYVLATLMGVVNSIETPARQAFVSEMVGRELLPNALALSAATFNTARVLGPALAGPLILVLSTGPVLLVTSAMYATPLVTLLRMRTSDLHRDERKPGDPPRVVDGLRYVWRRPDLVLPLAVLFVVGMLGFNFQLTLAVLAKSVFQRGAEQFGLLSTAIALGALGGALAGSRRQSRPSVYVVLGAAIGFGGLETLVSFAPTFAATAILLIPTGFFMIYFVQAANQRLQLSADAAFRGRVMALFVLVFVGTTPVGAPLIGWLSEQYGPRLSILLGGAGSLLAGVVALGWQLRRSGARIRVSLWPMPRLRIVAPAASSGAPAASSAPSRRTGVPG